MFTFTVPPSVICGLTRRSTPTSWRENVVNGCTVDDDPVVAYEPVGIGMFWPTTIRASFVESEQRRRREDVRLVVVLERLHEQREVADHPKPGDRDRAVDKTDVQAVPHAAQVHRGVDDVAGSRTALAEVRAAQAL